MKKIKINWNGISIVQLLQILFSITMIAVLLVFNVVYYNYTSNLLKENIKTSLRDFAISAQYIIDGEKHKSIKDPHSNAYKEMCAQLAKYKKDVGVYDVYTIVKSGEQATKLFLAAYDAEETFLQDYIYSKEIGEAFKGKITTTPKPYTDNFGTFYSGYAPLRDHSGNIVAVVAVDINIDSIQALKANMMEKAITVFLICFVIGNILIYFLAKSLGNSFRNMIGYLSKMGEGDLSMGEGPLSSEPQGSMAMFAEMKILEHTLHDMAKKISNLVDIIAASGQNVNDKAEHILDMIVTSDTASQIMASTVEEMSSVNRNAASTFEDSLSQLLLYKEDTENSAMAYKNMLDSVQETKTNLEAILQFLRREPSEPLSPDAVNAFEIICQDLYLQYDIFSAGVNNQMSILDHIGERRDELLKINQSIAGDFKLISSGNNLVVEVMEKQVEAMRDAVSDVEMLKNMALDLQEKIGNLKTKEVD